MTSVALEAPNVQPRLYVMPAKPKPKIIRPTDEDHQKWEKFAELGKELHLPVFKFMWRIKNRDRDGNVLHDYEFYSRTWHRNAYNWLATQLMFINLKDNGSFGAGFLSFTNVAGSISTQTAVPMLIGGPTTNSNLITNVEQVLNDSAWLGNPAASAPTTGTGIRGGAGNDVVGLVVGSDATAEDFDDVALGARIVDGTGTGELSYVEQAAAAVDYNAGTLVYTTTHQRFYNNNSGGQVDVNEVGIYAHVRPAHNGANGTAIVMMVRDVLGATVEIPDTGQLDVAYDIALTFLA